jgi:hypothetical protein
MFDAVAQKVACRQHVVMMRLVNEFKISNNTLTAFMKRNSLAINILRLIVPLDFGWHNRIFAA